MTNSRATRGLILLDKHIAATTEASYIYNTLIKSSQYSKIIIQIMGGTTAALEMQLIINSNENTNYQYHKEVMLSGTKTDSETLTVASLPLASTAILTAVTMFNTTAEIILNSLDESYIHYTAYSQSGIDSDFERYNGLTVEETGDLTEIEIQTSTSTWIAGTRILIWGQLI